MATSIAADAQLYDEELTKNQSVDLNTQAFGGFIRRGFAYLIDILILDIFIFFEDYGAMAWPDYIAKGSGLTIALKTAIIGYVILYFPLLEGSPVKATIGKYLMGLKVVDSSGQRLSWKMVFIRYYSKIFLAILTAFFSLALILFNHRKQGLHDLVCGSYVVKRR